MTGKDLWPVRAGLRGTEKKEERKRIEDVAVDSLLSYLRDKTGCEYDVTGRPDEIIRNKPAADREVANKTRGTLIGLELVDDFSWDEQQGAVAASEALIASQQKYVDIPVEDPRGSLLRVIADKHGKGQLRRYEQGCRILLIGLARHGAALLGVDVIGIEGLRESMTYMDRCPDIDHIFLFWLEASVGVRVELLWSHTALP